LLCLICQNIYVRFRSNVGPVVYSDLKANNELALLRNF